MNLREGRIGKERAFFVSAICGGDIAAARVCRKIKNISIPAGREHNGVACVLFDLSRAQAPRDDPLGVSVGNHQVEHLRVRKHLHGARVNLTAQRLITTEQKLLTGLSPCVKRS